MTVTIERYQPSDFEAVVEVINAAAEDDPERMITSEVLQQQFMEPGTNVTVRGLVARDEDGKIAGFGRFHTRQKRSDAIPIQEASVALHPAHLATAGTLLIQHLWKICEEVSRHQGESGFIFQVRCDDTQIQMQHLVESLGLQYHRLLVTLELDPLPVVEPPVMPQGIQIRPARKGIDDQAWYHAYEDAFDDHWGQMVWPVALWEHTVAQPAYQPELNLIAWDAGQDEIAGFCYATAAGSKGSFRWLGVRPHWRRRGLGDVLTKAGLHALYTHGVRSVVMGADYQSDTGPARIYEKNGFNVIRRHLVYRREFVVGS